MIFPNAEYRVHPSPADPKRTSLFRPVIRVRMTGTSASRTIWALLDAGADESYICEVLARKLGVTPISKERAAINSASGEMHAWFGNLSLEFTDDDDSHVLPITVGVIERDWSEMILGHVAFFEHFDAALSNTDRLVTLTARATSSNS